MKIGILGCGNIGGRLGRIWAEKGHEIVFGSRDPGRAEMQELVTSIKGRVRVADQAAAVADAELVLLAVPWQAAQETLAPLGDWDGRILVDCINPIAESFDRLDTRGHRAAAEAIAGWAPGARVVKAFNAVSAKSLDDTIYSGQKADLILCGDDAEAKAVVSGLGEEIGFEIVDSGPLEYAVYLESLAMFWILMAYHQDFGSEIAIKLLKR